MDLIAHACCPERTRNTSAELRAPRARKRGLGPMSSGGGCCEFAQACDPLAVLRPRPLDCEAFIPGFFGTLLNVLLLPLLLPYNALAIYLLPCVVAYARRLLGALSYLLCFPCRAAWPDFCLFKFHDREFPPSASSIGARNGKSDASWALASELALGAAKFSKREKNAVSSWDRPCLFNRGPDASDIDQGGLGDCWLMSAFACAAEVPGLIQGVFVTPNFNPRGMYQVRLFDGNAKRWVLITIDEWIPATGHAPAFAQPAGNEMWCMLLEKAFAKYCGSYAKLDGGRTMWALHWITGDHCFPIYKQPGGSWVRNDVNFVGNASDRRKIAEFETDDRWDSSQLFDRVLQYSRKGAIIAAGKFNSLGTEGVDAMLGIVSGHAYSVLAVELVTSLPSGHTFRLVKMRNPWGDTPWKGKWADGSEQWAHYPDLRERLFPLGSSGAGELDHEGEADAGTFWMQWEDFCAHWDHIEICDRSSGVRDLALDLNEEDGCIGPTIGCVLGCGWYWACCQGLGALYCKHTGSDEIDELESRPMRFIRGIPRRFASYFNACMRCFYCG
ncbi:hypothetical protein T492DRAFT_912944 [Pavlovales sp. CCMP2436]|nr:hypothetical protein T492DRAFT_912944 [Pavlovales sp. CCMP2436]